MKRKITLLAFSISCFFALCWGQTWDLTVTMKATLDKNILTISTTKDAEEMPDFDWISTPWYANNALIHSVVIKESITSIGVLSFQHCTNLTSVTMPDMIKSIGAWAFYNCYSLTSVTIPKGVTTIGNAAFKMCPKLTEVEIPALVSFIGPEVFTECHLLKVIKVHADNTVFSSSEGILYNKNKTTLLIYPEGKDDKTFVIPSTVVKIEDSAFYQSMLESVTIPNSVTTIGSNAFWYCTHLTFLTIPKSVKEIGYDAFDNCTGLEEVTVEWSTPLSVPTGIFDNVNTSVVTLKVPNGTKTLYQTADVWKTFGTIAEYEFSGNEKIKAPALKVFASNGILHITGLQPGKPLYIYSLAGQLLYHGTAMAEEAHIPFDRRGFCIVISGEQRVKTNIIM